MANIRTLKDIVDSSLQLLMDEMHRLEYDNANLRRDNSDLKAENISLRNSRDFLETQVASQRTIIQNFYTNDANRSQLVKIAKDTLNGDSSNKILAIKAIREATNWGLKDAKDFVDEIISKWVPF